MNIAIFQSHFRTLQIATLTFVAAVVTACSSPRLQPLILAPTLAKSAVQVSNYCTTNGYVYTDTFAVNLSSEMQSENWLSDVDYDGLPDILESQSATMANFNIGPLSAFTSGTPYSDSALYLLGVKATSDVNLSTCPFAITQDTDNDNLTDCDEALLHTDRLNPDSDSDGIPDGLEVRNGTNPLDPSDSTTDTDLDGYSNLTEIKMNTPINVTNSAITNDLSVKYNVVQVANNSSGNPCYNITVSNFPTLPISNGNVVRIFVTETKAVIGSGISTNIQTLTVVVPENLQDGATVAATGLNNQTLNGLSTPLTLVENK